MARRPPPRPRGRPRKNPHDPKWHVPVVASPSPAPPPVLTVIPEPEPPRREPVMEWRTSPPGFTPWGDRLDTIQPSKGNSWSGGWWTSKPEPKGG